jgi:WD40 repeat protein
MSKIYELQLESLLRPERSQGSPAFSDSGATVTSCFEASDRFVAVGKCDGSVLILDPSSKVVVQELKGLHEGSPVRCIGIEKQQEYGVSCSEDGHVFIWFLDDASKTRVLSSLHVDGLPTAISVERRNILVGDDHGRVNLLSNRWLGPTSSLVFKGTKAIRRVAWRGTQCRMVEYLRC